MIKSQQTQIVNEAEINHYEELYTDIGKLFLYFFNAMYNFISCNILSNIILRIYVLKCFKIKACLQCVFSEKENINLF